MPCLLLDGAEFSTGPAWEASLDGEHWMLVEASEDGDPERLPDAEREVVMSVPVLRIVDPDGPPRGAYAVAPGHDLLLDFGETELGAGPDPHGSRAYGQMLLAAMFADGARLAQAWQDETAAERWRQAASRVAASIRSTFWQPQDGLYANGFDRAGRFDTRRTTFAQAFAVAFDVAEPAELPGLFRFLDDERTRPVHFSLSQVVELTAYAKAGRAAAAVTRLRSVWLPMIRQGYRRFFEDIHPTLEPLAQLAMYGRKYGNSLCHAWAGAAPVMALSRGVLGVEPIDPGYRVCTIAPQRCGLEWVRGAVPTPTGVIEIEWHAERGTVTLPGGVSARLVDNRVIEGPDRFAVVVS